MSSGAGTLGRLTPPDFDHVAKFPLSVVQPFTIAVVERVMGLPSWHWSHNQGGEGACVGHGVAMERAITNTAQNRIVRLLLPGRRYDPLNIWNGAKPLDPWPDTNPGDNNGTSVSAAYDFCRITGPRRAQVRYDEAAQIPVIYNAKAPMPADGVSANRWARNTDEIRTAISGGMPVAIGVDWYDAFDSGGLVAKGSEWFIRKPDDRLGQVRGGHCVCLYGASDRRGAFKLKNSWGRDYPLVWLPYETMEKLLSDNGEACIVTDR